MEKEGKSTEHDDNNSRCIHIKMDPNGLNSQKTELVGLKKIKLL